MPTADSGHENAQNGGLAKRPRGRPKGSKNGPNAGAVGRPRKDGQAPRKRTLGNAISTPTPSNSRSTSLSLSYVTGTASASCSLPPPADEVFERRSVAEVVPEHSTTSAEGAVVLNLDDSHAASILAPPAHVTLHSENAEEEDTGDVMITSLVDHTEPDMQGDEASVVDAAVSTKLKNVWAPPHGLGLSDEYDDMGGGDESDEDEVDSLFDDPTEELTDEFKPITDDDESELLPMPEASSPGHTPGARRQTSTIPSWLFNDYSETRERILSEIKSNPSRMPTCYVRGSFFDSSCMNPFLAMQLKACIEPKMFYKPTYFVWIPHLLVRHIPCPECVSVSRTNSNGSTVYLMPNGWPKMPRRVVDLEHCIYIIGHRYLCPHSSCKKSYQSWSPRLLQALPRPLALQFPFHLTYRSGLSDRVVSMMRLSFLQGIGPNPFARMIRTSHIRHYEQLHLQYLEMLYVRQETPFAMTSRYDPFSAFDDKDGYAGFSPTAPYFRGFYVNFLSQHASKIDQYTAMLSARILQLDHSFKVAKHLSQLYRVPVFTAVHTGVNEFGEIRSMILTPTKAHNQFMPGLKNIVASLEVYGHQPIEAVFTDSPRQDAPELENTIPSLLIDVVPVPDPSGLQHLTIPADISVIELSSEYQVRVRFDTILNDLKNNQDSYAAVDMEWAVDRSSGIQGKVALISVMLGKEILLIPLKPYLKNTGAENHLKLPHSLLSFLRAPQIRKVGVKISGDFTRLFRDCGFIQGKDKPFAGAVDLGTLAKESGASSRATVGLADLCATILQRFLPKDPEIRVSTLWNQIPLPTHHAHYAALDAYASAAVFQALSHAPIGGPVDHSTIAGTKVELLSRDRARVVARGIILPERPNKYQGITITKVRVLVSVTEVLVPGHIVSKDISPTHESLALATFAEPPFVLVCKTRHLRIYSPNPFSPPKPQQPKPTASSNSHQVTPASKSQSNCLSDEVPDDTDHAEGLPWYSEMDSEPTTSEQAAVQTALRDPVSHMHALRLASLTGGTNSEGVLRTRVCGDIFHGMKQFNIQQAHGLRRPFARALRDAIFQYDAEDLANIKSFLASKGVTWEYMLRTHSHWLLRRVRRYVPGPEDLLPRVKKVLFDYGPLVDATTNKPLFSDSQWDTAKSFLENIRRGYFSDPVNIKLYYPAGRDKHGLLTYRCVRGTNGIEGGVHQNIIRWFGAFNAGPDFAVQLLRDYTLYHNLRVGHANRTGTPYVGSFDIWTRNQISHLVDILSPKLKMFPPGFGPRGGWINGDNYVPSQEVFGILPIPLDTQETLGMHKFEPEYAKGQKMKYTYLARQQNTLNAVVPVHTKAERGLFTLLASQLAVSGKREPNWEAMAIRWSTHANGKTIFYKLPEQLKAYGKTWGENSNEKNSVKINQETYDQVAGLLRMNTTAEPRKSLSVANPVPLQEQITAGTRDVDQADEVDGWRVLQLLDKHSLQQTAVQFDYVHAAGLSRRAQVQAPAASGKRPATEDIDQRPLKIHTRKPRTCPRPECHRADCEGRFNSRPCKYPGM